MLKIVYFFFIYMLFRFCESYNSNNIVNDEINCLNDLSIIELLKIRKSLEKLQCSDSDDKQQNNEIYSENIIENDVNNSDEIIESRTLNDNKKIIALPLIGSIHKFFDGNKNLDRSFENVNEHHHQMWDKPKPTKLETVFQLSITALSFLAFGGYLLCMIVQAIKSKGTTYFHPVPNSASQTNTNPLKKIKVYRRQRRSIKKQIISTNDNFLKNATSNFNNNIDRMALPNPNDMYKILILFAEGYVKLTDIK